MQQTFPISPPLSEAQQAANAFAASLTSTTSIATLPRRSKTEAARHAPCRVIEITPTRTHLQRLQFIQAVCENQVGQPSFLTVADAGLALRGLERYFAPLFERRQLSLSEVRETLLWAEEQYGDALLVEDIIQALVARVGEEQYLRHRQARERSA
jgi:hypothetical protein